LFPTIPASFLFINYIFLVIGCIIFVCDFIFQLHDVPKAESIQRMPDSSVSEVVGEHQYIVEFEDEFMNLSPPRIIEPLQPAAVLEGI